MAPGEEARDLDRVLVGLASACGEDRLRQVARRDLREEPGQGGAALLAERRRDVADAFGLLLDGTHDARVAVPEVHVDETGAEIEDAPVARVQPRPLRAGDDHVLEAGLRRPRDEDVIGGVLRDRRWIGGALRRDGHGAESSRANA